MEREKYDIIPHLPFLLKLAGLASHSSGPKWHAQPWQPSLFGGVLHILLRRDKRRNGPYTRRILLFTATKVRHASVQLEALLKL